MVKKVNSQGNPTGSFGIINTPTGACIGAFFFWKTQELHCIVLKDHTLEHMNIDSC